MVMSTSLGIRLGMRELQRYHVEMASRGICYEKSHAGLRIRKICGTPLVTLLVNNVRIEQEIERVSVDDRGQCIVICFENPGKRSGLKGPLFVAYVTVPKFITMQS